MSEALDLASAMDGARLSGMLPYLTAELKRMEEGVITRLDLLMRDQKLTPDLAQMAAIELLGYRRLSRRFEQKVRAGISAGQRQAPLLNGEPPLPI